MVQFKVGDVVNICASVSISFCATQPQYQVADINISTGTCTINTYPPGSGCPTLSGISLDFQWVNSRDSTCTHYCDNNPACTTPAYLKTLGSASTDSNGVASLSYTITQNDLNLFNANSVFDLRVCITNKPSTQVINAVRDYYHLGDYITIIQDLCLGVICPSDDCTGPDLYTYTCNPSTGLCDRTLKETNSIICTQAATHYIEYDFSIFPSEFLNLISSNITFVSDRLGGYIPLGSNIQYITTTYDNVAKKFKMYFKYTPSLSTLLSTAPLSTPSTSSTSINDTLISIQSSRYIYNQSTGRLQTLVTLTDMVSVAAYVTGILILVLVLILGLLNPWIAAFGIVLGIALLYYKLVEIQGGTTSGSGPAAPDQQIKVIKEYVDTYLSPDCDALWPTCATSPPTCDSGTMRAYLACIGPARWAQCQHAKTTAGLPVTDCDIYKTEIQDVDTCLANNSCSPTNAKDRITNNVVNPVKDTVEQILTLVTCPTDQIYNKDTQKCEDTCWIPNPVGGCILTARTGKTMLLTASLLIGGLVVFKMASRPKVPRQEIIVKPEK